MVRECDVRAAQLAGQRSRSQVARRANFQRDAALRKQIHQRAIVHGGDSVSDPRDAQDSMASRTDARIADFTRVNQQG